MVTAIDTVILNDIASLAAPDITRLTTRAIEGTGVFDVLMATTKLHLLEEYNAGRISGQEYTTVYLGALTAVLQQSVAFLLSHQQEEKIIAEIALIRQKTVTELTQTDDTIPEGLGFNGDTVVEGLVKSQKDLNALQANLVTSQIEKEDAEKDLLGQKIVSELAQTCDNLAQASAAGYGYNDTAVIEGLIKAQQDRTVAEVDLMNQKLVTEVAQTSDTKPIALGQMSTTTTIAGLALSQKEKIDAEVILLSQKSITELSQTSDAIPTGTPALNVNTTVAGMVDKQKTLLTRQSDGFLRDAEQKATKMLIDAWSVDASVNSATANSTNKLDDANLGAMVTKLKTGIGV